VPAHDRSPHRRISRPQDPRGQAANRAGSGELHGLYEPEDEGKLARISVWMRTAQKKNVVAFKTFLRTLIHELCHHLDYDLFALEETFHTEGFYKRESTLVAALLAQLPPPQSSVP
jgi:hypothetical protein